MSSIYDVAETLQRVLQEDADRLGRETGFIERQREFSGASFAQTLVFGWMANPSGSLDELQQTAATLGVEVSPQAIDQRFTKEAAIFMQQVFETAVTQAICAETPTAIGLFERFTGVYVDDGSVITLPAALLSEWEGCGGTSGATAAMKLQLSFDLKYGGIRGIWLRPGKEPDAKAPSQHASLPTAALRIHDKGFHSLQAMQRFLKQQIYCLAPLKFGITTMSADGHPFDVLSTLQEQRGDEVDIPVQFGARDRVTCRVLAQRVSAEVADVRRAHIREEARHKNRPPSERVLAFADWTVLVTTVPSALLTVREAMVLYRVRWQIELMFKLWKSLLLLDEWRSEKPWRIVCEIMAKLVVVLVLHWIFLTTCWPYADKSLFKAAVTIKKFALALARVVASRGQLCAVLCDIKRCLTSGCRAQKRKRKPATFQQLLNPS